MEKLKYLLHFQDQEKSEITEVEIPIELPIGRDCHYTYMNTDLDGIVIDKIYDVDSNTFWIYVECKLEPWQWNNIEYHLKKEEL